MKCMEPNFGGHGFSSFGDKISFHDEDYEYTTQNYAVTCIVLCTLLNSNKLTKSVLYDMCRILIASLYVIR